MIKNFVSIVKLEREFRVSKKFVKGLLFSYRVLGD